MAALARRRVCAGGRRQHGRGALGDRAGGDVDQLEAEASIGRLMHALEADRVFKTDVAGFGAGDEAEQADEEDAGPEQGLFERQGDGALERWRDGMIEVLGERVGAEDRTVVELKRDRKLRRGGEADFLQRSNVFNERRVPPGIRRCPRPARER